MSARRPLILMFQFNDSYIQKKKNRYSTTAKTTMERTIDLIPTSRIDADGLLPISWIIFFHTECNLFIWEEVPYENCFLLQESYSIHTLRLPQNRVQNNESFFQIFYDNREMSLKDWKNKLWSVSPYTIVLLVRDYLALEP